MGIMSRTLFKRGGRLRTNRRKTKPAPTYRSQTKPAAPPTPDDRPQYSPPPRPGTAMSIAIGLLKSSQKKPKIHVRIYSLSGSDIEKKKSYYVSTYIDGIGHMESSSKKADWDGQKKEWKNGDLNWVYLDPKKVEKLDSENGDLYEIKLRFEVWRVRRFWRDFKVGTTRVVKALELLREDDEKSTGGGLTLITHRDTLALVYDKDGSTSVDDFKVEFTFTLETWE